MARIGEYRLKIYELLYNTPLYDFAESTEDGKKELHVLLLGNGWAGNEAFKAIFWVGQYLDATLHITVASHNALAYERELKKTLPAFDTFVNRKHYANVRFLNVDVEGESSLADALDFEQYRYHYTVVALGDAERNWFAASEVASSIQTVRELGTLPYHGKIAVNVFDEFKNDIADEDQRQLIEDGKKNGIEISFFGNDARADRDGLLRIAKNINFAYAMRYNQRIGKAAADLAFDKSLLEEFTMSPLDREGEDLSIVGNFLGGNYTADSSLAAALHIPYKLAACRDFCGSVEPEETLKRAIKCSDKESEALYGKLVALEHRRWNAYMVMRGYRAPTEAEEEKYLYRQRDGRFSRHKYDPERLHICLCDCGEKGPVLGAFDAQYEKWIRNECPKNIPSELDRASLRCHQLTKKLTEGIRVDKLLPRRSNEPAQYEKLRKSAEKLLNDEENAYLLYEKTLEKAKEYAASVSDREAKRIADIEQALLPAVARNTRMDFLSLDAQLVEMIPFALWYGKKYRTVITVSDGAATRDTTIPTLFSAENAIFLMGKAYATGGGGEESEIYRKYKSAITAYFEKRGKTTTPIFEVLEAEDTASVFARLRALIDERGVDNVVIHSVPHRNQSIGMALGQLIAAYGEKLSVVGYDAYAGAVPFSGDREIGIGLNNQSYSVAEFVELLGGKISTAYEQLYSNLRYEALFDLFQKQSGVRSYTNAKGESNCFVPWIMMGGFFRSNAADDSEIDKRVKGESADPSDPPSAPTVYEGSFSKEICDACGIIPFLKRLEQYKIIRNCSETVTATGKRIRFDCFDPGLIDILREFEADCPSSDPYRIRYKRLKFTPAKGFRISDLFLENKKLYEDSEHQTVRESKKKFLDAMRYNGFIERLTFHEDGRVSFVFCDEATMELFKMQGKALELFVYDLLRESALFDDTESGAKISWDAGESSYYEALLQRLNQPENADLYGYRHFLSVRDEVRDSGEMNDNLENEFDVIAMNGMEPIFVSCKTGKSTSNDWVYEIAGLSAQFGATGVLATSIDFSKNSSAVFCGRAYQMNVSLLGAETLFESERRAEALKKIVRKKVYRYIGR